MAKNGRTNRHHAIRIIHLHDLGQLVLFWQRKLEAAVDGGFNAGTVQLRVALN